MQFVIFCAESALISLKTPTMNKGINSSPKPSNKNCKPHPILAAFLDYYFFSLSIMSLLVLIQALTSYVFLNRTFYIAIFIILILADILYHAWLNKKIKYLSYGEIVAGKKIVNNKKTWTNPYKKNRFLLFLFIVISFLLVGNTWNNVMFIPVKISFVIGSLLKLTAIFYGTYLIGRGKIKGALIAMLPFLFGSLILLSVVRVSADSIYQTMMVIFLVVTMGLITSYFVYREKKQ